MNWTALGSAATALAVLVAAGQLHSAALQAKTALEDALSKEYRDIVRSIPAGASLGEHLDAAASEQALSAFLQYFDLSNQQAFLHKTRRISKATWEEWRSGIKANLKLPAFSVAWEHLLTKAPERYKELQEEITRGLKTRSGTT